jgi:hypothetical protein
MNSGRTIAFIALAALTALAVTGCGQKTVIGHTQETVAAEPGVTFSAKKGLLVPQDTAKFIGLKVADVEERKLAAEFQFSAQVYRAASEVQFASQQLTERPATLASGNVSPAEAATLREGQTVSATHGDDNVPLPGHILALKRGLEKTSGQVEVLLAIADAAHPLPAGASLSVTAPLGGEKGVVSVPRSALFRTTEGDFVYTVSGDHFMRAPVKLGIVNHEFAEVTDGLYAGDQIVVQPVMTLWLAELQSLRGGKACADGQ